MVLDDRPVRPLGGDADSAPGQPALGGCLKRGVTHDIRPVSAVPGKPILDLNEACQGLTDQWDVGHTKFEDEVLMLTNEARSEARRCGQYGMFPAVPPVFPNELLRCAARLHSLDMVERGYFDHADPEGVGPDVRTTDTGYPWVAVGENIAAGSNTPRKVVDGWIDSPGHCKNIMSPDFDELGVGYTPRSAGRFTHYWTQVFGRRR